MATEVTEVTEGLGNAFSLAIILPAIEVMMNTEKEMIASTISGILSGMLRKISKRTTSMKNMKEILKIVEIKIKTMKKQARSKTPIIEKVSMMTRSIKVRNSTKRNTMTHFSHLQTHQKEPE